MLTLCGHFKGSSGAGALPFPRAQVAGFGGDGVGQVGFHGAPQEGHHGYPVGPSSGYPNRQVGFYGTPQEGCHGNGHALTTGR